jgi:hypothetical protein
VSVKSGRVAAAAGISSEAEPSVNFRVPEKWGPPSVVVRRPPGVLVGFDGGEWGGALLAYSQAGALLGTLLRKNVIEILPEAQASIVLVGLAHMGESSGRVVEVLEEVNRFRVGRSVDLGGTPRTAIRDPAGTLVIVTNRGLVRISADFTVLTRLASRWQLLMPSAVVVDEAGVIYVGMRGLVAKWTPSGTSYLEEWLFPPSLK